MYAFIFRNVDEHKLQHCCSLVANWLTNAAEGDTFQLTHHDYECECLKLCNFTINSLTLRVLRCNFDV